MPLRARAPWLACNICRSCYWADVSVQGLTTREPGLGKLASVCRSEVSSNDLIRVLNVFSGVWNTCDNMGSVFGLVVIDRWSSFSSPNVHVRNLVIMKQLLLHASRRGSAQMLKPRPCVGFFSSSKPGTFGT